VSHEDEKQRARADAANGVYHPRDVGILDGFSSQREIDKIKERKYAYDEAHADKKREMEEQRKKNR
jgi:hypothetical protein